MEAESPNSKAPKGLVEKGFTGDYGTERDHTAKKPECGKRLGCGSFITTLERNGIQETYINPFHGHCP